MKQKVIDIPIFKGKLILCAPKGIDELCKSFPDLHNDGEDFLAREYGCVNYKGNTGYIIALNINRKKDITYSTIVHEAVHVCLDVYEHKGVEIHYSQHEFIAYFVEWITNECEIFFKGIVI